MKRFTTQKTISAISRQTYTGSKSAYAVTGTTGTGYLRPMSAEQAGVNSLQYGLAFELIVETSLDLREGDKITISDIVYLVKGMVLHDRGTYTQYRKCTLLKSGD